MGDAANVLNQLSNALESRARDAGSVVVAIRNSSHQHVTGVLWQPDAVITSEQALGERNEYEIVTAAGDAARARIVGRDPGTNLLVLRPERELGAAPRIRADARTGAFALALGANVEGAVTARLGIINAVGPQWWSRAGGRIEQRIALDIRLGRTEEGGAVLDANGAYWACRRSVLREKCSPSRTPRSNESSLSCCETGG